MKKMIVLAALTLVMTLNALQVTIDNPQLTQNILSGYTIFDSGENTIYNQQSGAPAIPQVSKFIDLNGADEITNIEVKAVGIKSYQIDKPLYPVQKPSVLSQENVEFTEMNPEYYQTPYPQNWLNSYNTGICGSTSLAGLTINAMQCNGTEILIPDHFEVTIEISGIAETRFEDNYAVNEVLAKLGLTSQERSPEAYLIITPMMFQNAVQPLIDWRFDQGYDVYLRTTGEISTQYEGEDLAAQIRACISDMQITNGVDFVTLVGDSGHIPARYVFAFDCAYGAHDGENDLASDMYYSCLDGNWNADADTLYGEDEDEVDLYPEVFVGRIPANSAADITAYTAKLIAYEKGLIDNYEVAGGISMELWDGSASEQCQQYIYDNYFPDEYDIDFIYGDENTEENVFAMISTGKNIIQHTGHAWINVLSLENYGHIYSYDIPEFTNDWGGMVYSIGCWSLAFDYDSVGEAFVRTPERNFIGYVGNSSYGWGAPSAPAFGFSEFYQREFFSTLFSYDGIAEMGAVQALQKLPFTAYYQGASVFKWVGYELNLSGDAAALLNTSNPSEMLITAVRDGDLLYVRVSDEDVPISNAVISDHDQRWITGLDGYAVLPWEENNEFNYSVYARNYRWASVSNNEVVELPVISISDSPAALEVNQSQEMSLSVINLTDETLTFTLQAVSEPEVLDFEYDPQIVYTVAADATVDLETISFIYGNDNQLADGAEVNILFTIESEAGDVIASTGLNLLLNTADFQLTEVNWNEDNLYAGNVMDISYSFVAGNDLEDINAVTITYLTENMQYLEYEGLQTVLYPIDISAGDVVTDANLLYIDAALPDDYFTTLGIRFTVNWGDDKEWSKDFNYCTGNANLQLAEDMETGLGWTGDDAWQMIDYYSVSGDNSLSCRPSEIGHYLLTTPLLSWAPATTLSFQYKFKMPMYGEDGFMLKYVTDSYEENIVFLGSGGALNSDNERPPSNVYIEADWAYYEFNLEDILVQTPQTGSSYQLIFDFNYAEIIEDFCEYATMPEVGVFIDDFFLGQSEYYNGEDDNLLPAGEVKIYPNPFYAGLSRREATILFNLPNDGQVDIKLYDIKGRLIRQIAEEHFSAGEHEILWDTGNIASGIYFLQVKQENLTKTGKMLILR